MPQLKSRAALSFPPAELRCVVGLYGFIALLHVLGWGSYLHFAKSSPALVGLGLAAYLFGLRHAFDADHIAAVDDTVRLLLQRGKQPLSAGFYFSLGHSTVVLVLAIAISLAATSVKAELPQLRNLGSVIGAGVSGTFLWLIGLLNLLILMEALKVWRRAKSGAHDHVHLEQLLRQRGLINRLIGSRFARVMNHSWHMYPLGLLFGLGFDTASEVGMLAMTAGASVGNLPIAAVLSLPLLFAAGMTLMDTTDGIFMTKAYRWALMNPLRKVFYNITTTSLSVAVALVIGTIELWQVSIRVFRLRGPAADFVAGLDFGAFGYIVVGLFLLAWLSSLLYWKVARVETRYLSRTNKMTPG